MPRETDEWATRAAFLERAEELTPLIAVDTDSGRFLLSTSDRNITPSLFLKGARGEMRSLGRAMDALDSLGLRGRGGTLIDVGANVGTTTVSALREHGFQRAVACEPESRNVLLLRLNLVANGLDDNVAVCPLAVGDSAQEVELVVARNEFGLHEVRPKGRPPPPWPARSRQVVRVPQVTLDALADEGLYEPETVSLLWMDVQGHEGHVLRGARRLTEAGVPIVLELYPEGLRRHGGLDHLRKIAVERYTHVVPLRGARGTSFDAVPVRRLARAVKELLAEGRFTDVLLVREPVKPPPAPGALQLAGGLPGRPAARRRRPKRDPADISTAERSAFIRDARRLTPLVAATTHDATFLVRTAPGSAELPLFVRRSHPRLRLLDAAVAVLDQLGLGERARKAAFADIGADVGLATVAALTTYGFRSAVAVEADPSAYSVLELNLTANGLRDRAQTLGPARLARRRALPAGRVGLIYLEDTASTDLALGLLRRHSPPVLLRLDAAVPGSLLERLLETHSHFVRMPTAARRAARPRLEPVSVLGAVVARLAERPRGKTVYVLAFRRPRAR